LNGRLQADYWFFEDYDNALDRALGVPLGTAYRSGFLFRRLYLGVAGSFYRHFKFKVNYNFADTDAGSELSLREVYLATSNLGKCFGCLFPDFQIGHMKEPISIDEQTSDLWTTFMERALPILAFSPAYSSGFMVSDQWYGNRVTYAVGWFGSSDDDTGFFNMVDGQAITGRVTWTPYKPCGCPCRVWEVGVAGRYAYDQANVQFQARPETALGQRIVSTGGLGRGNHYILQAETAVVWDRWSFQAEYWAVSAHARASGGRSDFTSYYGQVSYWLTGPCRNYKAESASFDRITPCQDWLGDACCGAGAWELAARYSFLDLNDGAVNGGEVWDVTFGINWHPNPNTRIMLNYVHSDVDSTRNRANVDQTLNAFGIRVQFDF
jgi:phosphate-selective porin OprO/OprP